MHINEKTSDKKSISFVKSLVYLSAVPPEANFGIVGGINSNYSLLNFADHRNV